MSSYKIGFLPDYSDGALLDELRRVAGLLSAGEWLTKTAYRHHGPKVSDTTLRRRFGGWKQALERAGLGHLYEGHPVSQKMKRQPARKLSNDDLVAELKRVHALVGKPYLTRGDFNRHSITSVEAIRIRFGSFPDGLKVAGIPMSRNSPRRLTDAQCFENLAAVWTHLGRKPKYREMSEPPSSIQYWTYKLRWRTWRNTLIAFVQWANSEGDPPRSSLAANQIKPGPNPAPQRVHIEAECREVRPGLRFKVFMRDRFRCTACGRSPATHLNIELHADHIVAVASGGKTTLENLQTLYRDCNLGKGRTPM